MSLNSLKQCVAKACQCKDPDIYEMMENLPCLFLHVILSYAETTLNKAFQIMQKTVIVETDLQRS